jgi:flagellar motor switch protein FliN/FliY
VPDTATQETVGNEQAEEALGEPIEAPQEEPVRGAVEEEAAESVEEGVEHATREAVEESTGEGVEEPPQEPVARATVGAQEQAATGQRTVGAARGRRDEEGAGHPIEFLSSIEVEAVAELGRAELTIGEVLGLRAGSVVQLNKMLGEPAELMVKDRLVARGEVVVVEDRFGLRITEVVAGGEE